MFRIFYAEKDATLYESLPTYNTGIDEILEVGKRYDFDGTTLLKSRSLLKFDVAEVSASLAHYGKSINDCKFMLQLYTSHAKNLPSDYTLVTKVVGDSWINGTGFQSDISTIGATWNGPASGSSVGTWTTSSVINVSYTITGSGTGGSWITGSNSALIASQSFSYQPTDINLDQYQGELITQANLARKIFPGVQVYEVPSLIDRAGLLDNVITNKEAIKRNLQRYDEGKKVIGCGNGIEVGGRPIGWVHINAAGDAFLCCNDYDFDFKFGNFKTQELRDFWGTEEHINLVQKSYDTICRNCASAIFE
jgi:hypothetical protein